MTTLWNWFTGLYEQNGWTSHCSVISFLFFFFFRSLSSWSIAISKKSLGLEALSQNGRPLSLLFWQLEKNENEKQGKVKMKTKSCGDGVKAARCLFALINESKHQTGCIPQVNPNFDTQSGVISPRCKYLLCNKRGNSTETDNYLLLWRWQNASSLTMCNWWLFHRASRLIWMCWFIYLFIYSCHFFFFSLNHTVQCLCPDRAVAETDRFITCHRSSKWSSVYSVY